MNYTDYKFNECRIYNFQVYSFQAILISGKYIYLATD